MTLNDLANISVQILSIVSHSGPLECFHSTLAFQKNEYRLNMSTDTMKQLAKLQRYYQPFMHKSKRVRKNHDHHVPEEIVNLQKEIFDSSQDSKRLRRKLC